MNVAFMLSSRQAIGGIETIAYNLVCALAARGHHLAFVTGTTQPHWRDLPQSVDTWELPPLDVSSFATVQIARVLRTSPLNIQSLSFFLRFLLSSRARRVVEQADVAVTIFEGEAVLFSRYLHRRNVGTVYYYHGGIDSRWATLDRSTRRVAISQSIATHSAVHHAYPCHGVVWPGVAREWFEQPCRADTLCEPRRLVYTGRLERTQKHPERLIACFAALAHEFPNLTLRLVGDGPMRSELERQARDARLTSRITFTGAQTPAGVRAELQQADLFLFPSVYESFGVSVLEAMAAGVPVIASDLPVLREATGEQASLVPSDDMNLWIETTRRLLNDPSLRQKRSEAGRTWARQFTWERAATSLERYMIEACEPHRPDA